MLELIRSEPVAVALIGGTAAILGSVATLLTELLLKPRLEKRRQKAEVRLWYLNFYLPRRIRATSKLHALATDLYWQFVEGDPVVIRAYLKRKHEPEEETESLSNEFRRTVEIKNFEKELTRSWVLLSPECREAFSRFRDDTRRLYKAAMDAIDPLKQLEPRDEAWPPGFVSKQIEPALEELQGAVGKDMNPDEFWNQLPTLTDLDSRS